jgi:hypothetical protein
MSLALYANSARSAMIAPGPRAPVPLGTRPGLDLLRRLATSANTSVVVPGP